MINLEEYEGELGNFEEEFEMKVAPPVAKPMVNAKVVPEQSIILNNINQN